MNNRPRGKRRVSKRARERSCESGKRRYRDHSSAVEALRKIKNESKRDRIPVRSYKCPSCKGWHLTSKG